METLVGLDLVDRGAMHFPQDRDGLSDRRNEDDIAALQPDVFGAVSGEDVTVKVYTTIEDIVTDDPNVAHRSARRGATRVIERIQDGGPPKSCNRPAEQHPLG